MLDKMISVSPPLKGKAPDSQLAESKQFRETSKSDYKKEFESALQKKLDRKTEDLARKKEETRKLEESRADKKENKSLGGTKKKVTEDDDKMVSNIMASNESKVEIPDSKIENLAVIEVDIPEKNKTAHGAEVIAAGLMPFDLTQKPVESAPLTQPEELLKPMPLPEIAAALTEQPAPLTESTEGQPSVDLAADLGADVGFKPDEGLKQSNRELMQKMQSFDADKNNAISEKAQTFQQNILNRLQNEQIKNVGQMPEQNFSGENQGDLGQKGSDQLKDFKSDVLDSNQLHQAAGQTHTEFKNQLGAASAVPGSSLAGQLDENREANISEIMNKAQYLVTKGGGEVSVKMSPEGLGELHLKVIFQDGKLNIEMQTQNKDIKKLVEESLSELKSGLAAHRLSLEHVKIDTVNATNADNNTQFQSNLNHNESRENAHEQWRNFQGNMNNQSGNQSSYAGSLNRSESVQQRGTSVRAATAAQALRTYGGTKGATVNRVA